MAWGWAPNSDLLRVDILNTIGMSMMLMGVVCWLVLALRRGPGTAWRWRSLPPDGDAHFPADPAAVDDVASACLPWPWSRTSMAYTISELRKRIVPGFSLDRLRLHWAGGGIMLQSSWARTQEPRAFFSLGLAGSVLIEFARWLEAQPGQLYAVEDYWHTSPSFFLIRLGMLLVILTGAMPGAAGTRQWGFSPLILLGQASLLVYWVHSNSFTDASDLPKHAMRIGSASGGLLIISLAMLALAYVRTKMKGRGTEVLTWLDRAPARTSDQKSLRLRRTSLISIQPWPDR